MANTCLFPGCKSLGDGGRGLCYLHYQQAYRLIQSGKVTWEKLEKEGKVLPTSRNTEKAADWFLENKKPTRTRRVREGSK